MTELCIVCDEGFVTQIEEMDGLQYYNCGVCGSDYATAEQVSHNLSLSKEMPSYA